MARLGKPRSQKIKETISTSLKGDRNVNSKRVYRYDLYGNLVDWFASCGEAARELGKSSHSRIARCARGEQKTAYEFKWSYVLL